LFTGNTQENSRRVRKRKMRRGEKINDLDISEPPGKPYYTQATHKISKSSINRIENI